MKHQIFPDEIIENTQEANFSRHSVRSRVIYLTVVVCFTCSAVALPLIKVDVGVRSQGLIRPMTDIIPVTAPVSGHIRSLHADEDTFIESGDVFAVLDAPQLTERIRFNELRQQELASFLLDLQTLQHSDSTGLVSSISLLSTRYQQAHFEFRQQLLNRLHAIDRINRVLERERLLFERSVVSLADLEETLFSSQAARNEFSLLVEQQHHRWKLDEVNFQNQLEDLRFEHRQLQQDLSRYKIQSPITGTVNHVAGIFENSFVHTNQILGEISPDTILIAEVYVPPRDIGLLREGQSTRFQIDAYNHNQWGLASGTITSIATDIVMRGDQPFFRVRCSLDNLYLELKNGYRGEIRKGMTFQARFIVSRRSLFQLLHDKADDWLEPQWGRDENTMQ